MPANGTVTVRFYTPFMSKSTSQLSINFTDSLYIYTNLIGEELFCPVSIPRSLWSRAPQITSSRPFRTGCCQATINGHHVINGPRVTTPHLKKKGGGRGSWWFWASCSLSKRRKFTFLNKNWWCHVIIVIKTVVSSSVIRVHLDTSKQYVESLGLRPRD